MKVYSRSRSYEVLQWASRTFSFIAFYPTDCIKLSPKPRFTGAEAMALSQTLMKNQDVQRIGSYYINTADSSTLSDQHDQYPLILFCSPGLPSAHQHIFQGLAEAGYIVLSLYHPDASIIPDKDSHRLLASDTGFDFKEAVIARDYGDFMEGLRQSEHRFSSRIDWSNCHLLGFSLGGSAAIKVSSRASGIRSCTNIDGSIFGGPAENLPNIPYFFIDQDYSFSGVQKELREDHIKTRSHILENPQLMIHQKTIRNATHRSFSDLTYLTPDSISGREFEGSPLEKTLEALTEFLSCYSGIKMQEAKSIKAFEAT